MASQSWLEPRNMDLQSTQLQSSSKHGPRATNHPPLAYSCYFIAGATIDMDVFVNQPDLSHWFPHAIWRPRVSRAPGLHMSRLPRCKSPPSVSSSSSVCCFFFRACRKVFRSSVLAGLHSLIVCCCSLISISLYRLRLPNSS